MCDKYILVTSSGDVGYVTRENTNILHDSAQSIFHFAFFFIFPERYRCSSRTNNGALKEMIKREKNKKHALFL